jgi:membrane-associated phospholipid phosphatase
MGYEPSVTERDLMQPVSNAQSRMIIIWTVVLSHALVLALLPFTNIRLDFDSVFQAYSLMAIPGMFCVYVHLRKMTPLQPACDTLFAGFLVTSPVVISTYLAISLNMPMADAHLIGLDQRLGFDWHAFVAFVDARPTLAWALAMAYSSFFFQLLLLPIYFSFFENAARAYAIVFAYTLLCFASSAISVFYPALGAFAVHGVEQADLAAINIKFGYFFLEQFHGVRDQAEFLLRFEDSAGILTFPSVHAGVAAICAWAAWDSRVLRYPMLFLNVGMAVSALSHGSHYLVDIVAGIGVAVATILVTKRLFGLESSRMSVRTAPQTAAIT